MGAGNRTFVGGLMLADSISSAIQRGRAIDAARRAERDHFGTVAQLAAALAAIRKMDPTHPLNSQRVRDHIDQQGQRAGSFAAAWRVDCDPGAIYSELDESHQKARAKAVAEIEKSVASHRGAGWFSRECFILFSVKFDTLEMAEGAKAEALRLASCAGLDDSVDPLQIVKAVANAQIKLMTPPEPVAGPKGERPAPRAFRRRRM